MASIDSPCHAYQAYIWAKVIATINHLDENKPFNWNRLVIKFPGPKQYFLRVFDSNKNR